MDVFTKQRITGWIIVLLVILNVCSLGATWVLQSRRSARPPRSRPDPVRHFLKEELLLTEEQAQQFEELRREHFLQSKAINDEAHQLKKAIMDELFSSSPDAANVEQLAEKIGEKQAELERLRFQHFMAVKSLFQPEQIEKFRTLLGEIFPPPGPLDPGRSQAPDRQSGPGGASIELAPGGPRQGPPNPPQEAMQACSGKKQGDTCEMNAPSGVLKGTCLRIQSQLACVPEGAPQSRPPLDGQRLSPDRPPGG